MLLVLAACGGDADVPAERVRVEDFRYTLREGGLREVTGRLINVSPEEIDAQLQIALYDAGNQRIGTLTVVVEDVPPDSARHFRKVLDVAEDVQGARVRSVLIF